MNYIEPLQRLIAELSKLPQVGQKTAQRYAYAIMNMPAEDVKALATSLVEVKQTVHFCKTCGNYTDRDVCSICLSRKHSIICVVAYPRDIIAIEKVKGFNGVYHCLQGTINPLDGIGPEQLKIRQLLARLDGVSEVIMATNPDITGEATSMYLAKLIKPLGVKVTRLASGIPMGSDIEYTDEVTLSQAINDRREL